MALGRPWQQVFARFDMHALAAASIAQIHRAALPDGTEVVVKIRRPGAASEQAETDMRILRRIVLVMQGSCPRCALGAGSHRGRGCGQLPLRDGFVARGGFRATFRRRLARLCRHQ
ncbi:AarF/UbiB family protein [Pseudomonas aeruginosa]